MSLADLVSMTVGGTSYRIASMLLDGLYPEICLLERVSEVDKNDSLVLIAFAVLSV